MKNIRKENYGVPVNKKFYYKSKNRYNGDFTVEKTYEMVNDNDKLRLRSGDIVLVNDDYFNISSDINGHFAVVIDRYRVIKKKPNGTFRDYMVLLMMITGPKKGHDLKMLSSNKLQKQFKTTEEDL